MRFRVEREGRSGYEQAKVVDLMMAAYGFLRQYSLLASTNAIWNRNLCRLVTDDPDLWDWQLSRTLHHMVAADDIWLARFDGGDPDLACLQFIQCGPRDEFWFRRLELDQRIVDMVAGISADKLVAPINYHNYRGAFQHEALGVALARFFNHQQQHQFLIHHGLLREERSSVDDWNCAHYF